MFRNTVEVHGHTVEVRMYSFHVRKHRGGVHVQKHRGGAWPHCGSVHVQFSRSQTPWRCSCSAFAVFTFANTVEVFEFTSTVEASTATL